MHEANKTHHCPICQEALLLFERYPHYVCNTCAQKASDKDGRLLDFYNLSLSGGFGAAYADTGEPYQSHLCYIDGIPCRADEARFGGIVIQKVVE